MDSRGGLGIARVALTVQVTIGAEKLDALLRDADKTIGLLLATRVEDWVRERKLGYYPALEFLVDQGVLQPDEFDALRALAATIRKRVKRDVQTRLWPVFSSVQIERAQSLAFMLPRVTPGRPAAAAELARHYFPNNVRLELVLASLDKRARLEEALAITEAKVARNLRDEFETVTVSAVRRLDDGGA
jgi:hypothetical protein